MSLTDPVSKDVSTWWAASPTSVAWVYGYGFSNDRASSVDLDSDAAWLLAQGFFAAHWNARASWLLFPALGTSA